MFMRVLNVAFYGSLIATVLFIVFLVVTQPWNAAPASSSGAIETTK